MTNGPPVGRLAPLRSIALIALVTTVVTIALIQVEGPAMFLDRAYQSPSWAVALHLGTVLPTLLLGPVILMRRKGGATHRRLGAVWAALMVVTAFASFWIRDGTGAFSGIHLCSVGTLLAIAMAIWRARARDIRSHKRIMVSLYVGLVVAGAFALKPNRVAGKIVWGVGRPDL